jgi:hypothetical protein
LHEVFGFAVLHVLGALSPDDPLRYPQANAAVDAALAAMVVLVIGVKRMNLVTQEVGTPISRMGDDLRPGARARA